MIPILAAEMSFLIDYAKDQYSKSRGLHLNSSDWKAYIHVGNPSFYRFITTGVIKFTTKTSISEKSYDQIIMLSDYKKIEPALLILFLSKNSDEDIASFLEMFFKTSNGKLSCTDPSFVYWGNAFNLTSLNAIYGPQELRPPNIRDPKQNNLVCKHLWVVLETYEKSTAYFAKNLIPYYKRLFGITSPTGIDRLLNSMNDKKIRSLVVQGISQLNRTKNNELISLYKKLTKITINNLNKKPEPVAKPQETDNSKTEEITDRDEA